MASKTAKTAVAAAGVVEDDQVIVNIAKGIGFDFKVKSINLNFSVQFEKKFVMDPDTDKETVFPAETGNFNGGFYIDLGNEQALNQILEENPYLSEVLPHLAAQITKAYDSFNDVEAAEARRQKKNEA